MCFFFRGKELEMKFMKKSLYYLCLFSICCFFIGVGSSDDSDNSTSISNIDTQTKLGKRIFDDAIEKAPVFGINFFQHEGDSPLVPKSRVHVSEDYILGPGDVLSIRLSGITNKEIRSTINTRGVLSIPEVSSIYINALSLLEARNKIETQILSVYKNLVVEVDIADLKDIDVYVSGRVQKPGSYIMRANSTLMDLLHLCGGPTIKGSFRDIRLLNYSNEKSDINSIVQNEILFDLYDLFIFGEQQDVLLTSGCRVIVPPVRHTVSILGSIKNPSRYEYIDTLSLKELINLAGGFLPEAYPARIEISRKDDLGFYDFFEIDYTDESNQSFDLRDGDIIRVLNRQTVIRENYVQITVNGNVLRPGQYLMPIDSTVSNAIESAGGIMSDGFYDGVVLTRQSLTQKKDLVHNKIFKELDQEILRYQSLLAERAVLDDDNKLLLKAQSLRKDLLSQLGRTMYPGRLIFDPNDEDPVLHNGDSLSIPRKPATITIVGAVFNSGSLPYVENKSLDDYLNMIGGINTYADLDSIRILKPTGLVFNKDEQIGIGDIVIVPIDYDKLAPLEFKN
jgi:protein involved in polysaccharide export with SLBB domain